MFQMVQPTMTGLAGYEWLSGLCLEVETVGRSSSRNLGFEVCSDHATTFASLPMLEGPVGTNHLKEPVYMKRPNRK